MTARLSVCQSDCLSVCLWFLLDFFALNGSVVNVKIITTTIIIIIATATSSAIFISNENENYNLSCVE